MAKRKEAPGFFGPKGALKRIHEMILRDSHIKTPAVLCAGAQRADNAVKELADSRKASAQFGITNVNRKCDI